VTAFSSLPVREVVGDPGEDDHGWPFTMGAVRQLLRDGLELSELTILVGENGVGKSTIIEAIAMAYGLSPEGGSTHLRPSERPTESPLHERIRLVRGLSRSRWGYFLRAETMHGLLTSLSRTRGPTVATMSARTARPSPSSSTPSWYTCPAGAGSWCSTSPRPGSRL
jgi:predicted ATPase